MAVLCDIKHMSQNPKYGYQCVKTKDKIAEWLDLSRATVFNAISALETKGYVERTAIGIKPSQFIFDLDSCQDEIGIYVKNGDVEMISKKVSELLDGQSKNYTTIVQNLDGDSLKFRLGQSKNYTLDRNRDIQEKERKINTPQPVVAPLDFMGLEIQVNTWLAYKKNKGKKYKDNDSIQIMIKKLHRYSKGNPQVAQEIIEDAMGNNYEGFFEPKVQTNSFQQNGNLGADAKNPKRLTLNIKKKPQYNEPAE